MEKIFKVRMKIWVWHSGPLKFAGVGKLFVMVPHLHFLKKRKCALYKIFVLNQSVCRSCKRFCHGSPLYTFYKIENVLKIKFLG